MNCRGFLYLLKIKFQFVEVLQYVYVGEGLDPP